MRIAKNSAQRTVCFAQRYANAQLTFFSRNTREKRTPDDFDEDDSMSIFSGVGTYEERRDKW